MELCQQQKRSSKKIKEKQPKKTTFKKQPIAIDIDFTEITDTCCEDFEHTNHIEQAKKSCDTKPPCKVELSACCKPGCSPRKPCMACVKKGVKVQVTAKECNKPRACCQDCPKKLTIKTRCEIKKSDVCDEAHETDCCEETLDVCKKEEDDIIDYCKLTKGKAKNEGNDSKKSCLKKSNSCKNLKQCPCTSCKKHAKSNNKCEKKRSSKNDDEKCCTSSSKTRNSCEIPKQAKQECIQKDSTCVPSSCPKSLSCEENYCEENCTEFEQDDSMSYFSENDANCCEPQNVSEIPSTRLPSVGSFIVPHISEQTHVPCPCGSRSCGNSGLIFQQAIQSQPFIATKRFP